MRLENLLNMDMGSVADWIEQNQHEYKLVHIEPQWEYTLPDDTNSMYWVRDSNDKIRMCYLMEYPLRQCWQGLDNTDFEMEGTVWIKIDEPEY